MSQHLADVEQVMRDVVQTAHDLATQVFTGRDLPLYDLIRYHLGWVDSEFTPAAFDQGKRIRPRICLLVCAACGGRLEQAAPTAAAIELLHNFTLIHDDVQDRSETRRHRPTVWSLWGDAQAINAGDALFALAQLALLRSVERGVPAGQILTVLQEFNRATLRIVEGQVQDLGFERRWDIGADDYLTMIGGKTAAIVSFAAWAGAVLGGADAERTERFRAFGRALGLGFQVRDDLLGIWGLSSVTGKPAADDIRRRKKSLPIIMLAEAASSDDLAELQDIYGQQELSESDVGRVLDLLERHAIEVGVQEVVTRYHNDARALLEQAAVPGDARQALEDLLDRLSQRAY